MQVVLADTTRRTTVATATNASQAIPFSEKVSATCPSFVGASAALREGVDDTAHAYAAALDALAGGLGESYAAHVAEGESLEHFHLFTRDLPPVDDKALHMHSDMGLFIVMTPAGFVELSTGEAAAAAAGQPHGLYLELPSGEVVRPALQSDSLLVMNGEGSHVWVESPLGEQLSVPRHEVDFPHIEGVGRVWFGRMVLPKRSALLQQQKTGDESTLMTFNEYRNQMFNVFHNGSAEAKMGVGCHPTQASGRFLQRHLLVEHAEADSCNSTQIYCWLSCMEIPDGCTADTVECQNSETRALWVPEDSHCMNCAPVCLTDGSVTGGSGGGMTDMNTFNVDVTPTPTPTPAVDSAVPATVIPLAAIISLAATLLAALLPVY
uniref:Uncharacterized protein n=1 Tax=Tetraselmis chuii TaxID=63592 RepID=A0A7S1SUQ8_9CHLO|mmetsp:Transcript_30131/g.53899  ORF Transcript_30131/g.53899 Transcript_30131/m.53899 type:complete len:379 (+) Transcript_30131:698-1834(+)